MTTLITISASHYCEKARWALERAGLAFREEAHAPLFSRLATRRGGLWGRTSSVPVLVDGHEVVRDSTEILRWADRQAGRSTGRHAGPERARDPSELALYPAEPALSREVEALEDRFDEVLGPHTRRLAYHHVLADRKLALAVLARSRIPVHEKVTARLLYPAVKLVLERAMRIDARGVARSRQKIDEVFAEVSAHLADGRRYLVGGRFTAADLTFAALAAPVLLPPQYGAPLPPLEALPAPARADRARLAATAAGALALRLYAEERGLPAAAGAWPRQ